MTDASSSTSNALILTPAQAVSSEPPDNTPLCGICRRQFSRYTCPRCNLLYCSLQCFRANAHSQCSEPFYRTQLESDIRAEPSKSAAERAQMMSLLKRFEEDNLDDPFDGEDDADDETDLERRLAGLNLDNATYDDLWAALTPAERAAFTKAVQDPSSALAQQLLTSPELADETVAPWWEEPSDAAPRSTSPPKKYGHPPEIIAIPPALLAPPLPDPPSFPLAYNLVATILAYAYATRRFAVSPLARCEAEADVRAAIVRVVPFLADKRSTVRFSTLEAVVTDIYSRFEEGEMTAAFFAILLRDAAVLLRPPRVALVGEGTPHTAPLRALSDLHGLFAPAPAAPKLVFYAAQAVRVPAPMLALLAEDAERRARAFDREGKADGPLPAGAGEAKATNEDIVWAGESKAGRLVEEVE